MYIIMYLFVRNGCSEFIFFVTDNKLNGLIFFLIHSGYTRKIDFDPSLLILYFKCLISNDILNWLLTDQRYLKNQFVKNV